MHITRMSAQALELARYKGRRLYVHRSLTNVDLNGDGKIDGFQFRFKNPMRRLNLFGIRNLKLILNGAKLESSKIIFHTKDKDYMVDDFAKAGFKDTIRYEGEEIKVTVKKESGLEQGKEQVIELWATILALEHANEFLLAYVKDKAFDNIGTLKHSKCRDKEPNSA